MKKFMTLLSLGFVYCYSLSMAQAQNMHFKLYSLKSGENVQEALQEVHADFSKQTVSQASLDLDYWEERPSGGQFVTVPAGGRATMIPGQFHVVELSGIKDIYQLTCEFDPSLVGFVGHEKIIKHQGDYEITLTGQDPWLNYQGFSREELGVRYDSGDKKGYLFKAPNMWMGQSRIITCENQKNPAQKISFTINY